MSSPILIAYHVAATQFEVVVFRVSQGRDWHPPPQILLTTNDGGQWSSDGLPRGRAQNPSEWEFLTHHHGWLSKAAAHHNYPPPECEGEVKRRGIEAAGQRGINSLAFH